MSPSPHLNTETSSFRTILFSSYTYLEFRTMDKVQKPGES
jgi:hypothetical protein